MTWDPKREETMRRLCLAWDAQPHLSLGELVTLAVALDDPETSPWGAGPAGILHGLQMVAELPAPWRGAPPRARKGPVLDRLEDE